MEILEMSRHITYVFRCTDPQCRYVERIADVPRKTQIRCGRCGKMSVLIDTEKTD